MFYPNLFIIFEKQSIKPTNTLYIDMAEEQFKPGYSYYVTHIPSGEDWYVIGVDPKAGKICVAGWPPTIANISDCKDFEVVSELNEKEIEYRAKTFPYYNWI